MTFDELTAGLKELIAQKVSFRRIAGASIFIYFFEEPGDASVVSIQFDPAWRYERGDKVIVGSYDFALRESDFGSKREYQEKLHRLCALCNPLIDSNLLSFDLDIASSDLALQLSNGQTLRNFANSAFDELAWVYRTNPLDLGRHCFTKWDKRVRYE
jgi:hypothetical protein